jgi:hypothetical protein
LTIYSIKYPAYLLGFALIMQKYVEITANGEIVNGTLKLNEIAAKTLLELIKNEGNSNLHTEYGVFSIFQTAFIGQDILYTENNKICMHDAVLSYFVLANDKTWDNLLATGENI